MRNSLKPGLIAFAILVTLMACDPPKTNSEKTPVGTASKGIDSTKGSYRFG